MCAQVLAVVGSMTHAGTGVSGWLLQLYSSYGEHLKTLRVPASRVAGLAWESGSRSVALAAGGAVLMAAVRQVSSPCVACPRRLV